MHLVPFHHTRTRARTPPPYNVRCQCACPGLRPSCLAEYCEGILPLLRAPLPRVWDRVGSGGPLAEPLRASVTHYGHPDISGVPLLWLASTNQQGYSNLMDIGKRTTKSLGGKWLHVAAAH